MKRFLIFAFLGPLSGGMVACIIVAPLETPLQGY